MQDAILKASSIYLAQDIFLLMVWLYFHIIIVCFITATSLSVSINQIKF